jgi:hypothetical protein
MGEGERGMKRLIITLAIIMALVGVIVAPMAVMASNSGTQNASTAQASTIVIVAKTADTDVTSITFPTGAPSAVVSNPYNNVDTADPQFLDGTASEPVVRLKNNSAASLTIWLGRTDWTNSAVASERYKLVDPAVVNVSSLTAETALTNTSTNTGATVAAGAYKALYLEVTLGGVSGKAGTSTITVLGES